MPPAKCPSDILKQSSCLLYSQVFLFVYLFADELIQFHCFLTHQTLLLKYFFLLLHGTFLTTGNVFSSVFRKLLQISQISIIYTLTVYSAFPLRHLQLQLNNYLYNFYPLQYLSLPILLGFLKANTISLSHSTVFSENSSTWYIVKDTYTNTHI